MPPPNPPPPRPRPVCVVVADPTRLGRDVQPPGGDVHYLLTAPPPRRRLDEPKRSGNAVHHVDDFPAPPPFRVQNLYTPSHADRSDCVRRALAHLHSEHHFGRIEFGLYGGSALRALQAKRAALAFADVELAVRLDECSRRLREREERWPGNVEDLERDYAERYSFEHADAVTGDDPAFADYLKALRWVAPEGRGGSAAAAPPAAPLVTIGIAHYNLGRYLPDTLASVAAQTYPRVEVIIIDDGSTDDASRRVFGEMESLYPGYQFLRHPNAGIGATRNRCLAAARGEYFLPMDADNIARPDMVERFVAALTNNPTHSAMTCYYLAFDGDKPFPTDEYLFAVRPTGGPHTLAGIRNVYGDANAIFRAADFRAAGGYETDRGTSCEDWEAFAKLVFAGKRVGVVPDHLFFYRHRAGGFSRVTNWYANHQRVLRQFTRADQLPTGEAAILWPALLGFQQRVEQLESRLTARRYRAADALHAAGRAATWPARKLYTTVHDYLIKRS